MEIDLTTTVRPVQCGYPFNAARDRLQDRAAWTFADLVEDVEKESEPVGAAEEDEVIDPEGDDGEGTGFEIATQMADANAPSPTPPRASLTYWGSRRGTPLPRSPWPGSLPGAPFLARPMTSHAVGRVLAAGSVAAREVQVERNIKAPSDVPSARVLRAALTEADGAGRATGGARAIVVTEVVD